MDRSVDRPATGPGAAALSGVVPTPTLTLTELASLTMLSALAVGAWLALLSAQAGRFSPGAAMAGGVLSTASVLALAGWGIRRDRLRLEASVHDLIVALMVAGCLWRGWPPNTPWPVFLDASWYVNTAARIAEDGSLAFHAQALDAGGAAARRALVATFADERAAGLPFPDDVERGFHAVAFAVPDIASGAVVRPYHPPFFAAALAIWGRWFGILRTGDGVVPWTVAFLLAAGAAATAAFGRGPAVLAVALLGVGPAVSYYGFNPYAEIAAGALALGGVWALVRLAGRGPPSPGLAFGGGLALGLACLTKVDLFPVAAVATGWWWHARRRGRSREGFGLALGLGLPVGHALWLSLTASRLYVALNGGGVIARFTPGRPWQVAMILILVASGLALIVRRGRRAWRSSAPPPRRTVRERHREAPSLPLLARSGGARRAVALLGVAGLGMAMAAGWWRPAAEPPPPALILAWLVTPLGLWAAAAGLVRALEMGDARHGLPIALALTIVPLLLVDPVVSRGLSSLYTARRFVPVTLPLVALFAAFAAAQVLSTGTWRGGAGRRRGSGTKSRLEMVFASIACLLVLAGSWSAASPFAGARGRDFAGGPAVAERLAAYGGARDVWLFASTLDGTHAGRMAAALWGLYRRPTAVVGSPSPEPADVVAAIAAWRSQGRRVFYIDDGSRPPPEWPGWTMAELGRESIVTYALAPAPELPPRLAPLPLDFRVLEVSPAVEGSASPRIPR